MNQADLITPLHIELMIHYRCKTTRFPRADAPAVIEYTNVLKDLGLIRETTKDEEGDYRATDRVFRAAYDFNASKKGRLLPVKTVGEAFENVPAKHFKDADVWVKTKTPVLVLRTNNEIPKE